MTKIDSPVAVVKDAVDHEGYLGGIVTNHHANGGVVSDDVVYDANIGRAFEDRNAVLTAVDNLVVVNPYRGCLFLDTNLIVRVLGKSVAGDTDRSRSCDLKPEHLTRCDRVSGDLGLDAFVENLNANSIRDECCAIGCNPDDVVDDLGPTGFRIGDENAGSSIARRGGVARDDVAVVAKASDRRQSCATSDHDAVDVRARGSIGVDADVVAKEGHPVSAGRRRPECVDDRKALENGVVRSGGEHDSVTGRRKVGAIEDDDWHTGITRLGSGVETNGARDRGEGLARSDRRFDDPDVVGVASIGFRDVELDEVVARCCVRMLDRGGQGALRSASDDVDDRRPAS